MNYFSLSLSFTAILAIESIVFSPERIHEFGDAVAADGRQAREHA